MGLRVADVYGNPTHFNPDELEVTIDEVGVGLAPGLAFSEDGEGWMRLGFAADTQTVSAAMDRLEPVLG